MAGIDIRGLAKLAFDIGKDLAEQAFEPCLIQLGPETVVDPIADTSSTVWAYSFAGIQCLPYDDEVERKARETEKRMKTFLVDQQDIEAADAVIDQTGHLTDESETLWEIYRVEMDPSRSAILFFCER
jgi:hypothetical protein